jgi:type VII secretion integral membrane protein EccD
MPDTAVRTVTRTGNTRVAITIPGHIVDLTLSPTVPISHIVSQLIPYLRQQLTGKPKALEFLNDPDAAWHLERFGSVSLNSSKTLDEEGILDGEALYLVSTPAGEKYPALIDDVAESIAYHQNQTFPPWKPESGIKLSLTLIQVVGALVAVVLGMWANRSMPSSELRYGLAGLCLTLAVALIAVGLTVVKSGQERLAEIPRPLFVVGYEMLAAAGLLIVPRKFDVPHIVVTSAFLFVASVLVYAVTGIGRDERFSYGTGETRSTNIKKATSDITRLSYGVATASLITLVVSSINLVYLSPPAVICVEIIVAAFFAVLMASRAALAFARISLPYVPATGEDYLKVPVDDVGSVSKKAGSSAVDSILNQEQQVLTAYDVIVGILSGALALIVGTAFFAGKHLDNHHWIIWSFIVVISTALIYRGKSYDDERLQKLCLTGAAATMTTFLVGLLLSPASAGNGLRFFLTLGILLAALGFAAIFSIQRRTIRSPIVMKLFEYIEMVLYATPIVYLVLALDLYQKVRAR